MARHELTLWTVATCVTVVLHSASAKFHYAEYKTVAQFTAARSEPQSSLMTLWSAALDAVTGAVYKLLDVDTPSEFEHSGHSGHSGYADQYSGHSGYSDHAYSPDAADNQHYFGIYPDYGGKANDYPDHTASPEYARNPEHAAHSHFAELGEVAEYPGYAGYPEYAEYPEYAGYDEYPDRLTSDGSHVAAFVPGGTIWVGLQIMLPVTVTAATAAKMRETDDAVVEGGIEEGG